MSGDRFRVSQEPAGRMASSCAWPASGRVVAWSGQVGPIGVGYDKDMVTNAPLLEDDEGSLSRGQEEKLYDYYGISYDATERGAAWTPPHMIWARRRAPRPPADTLTDRTTCPRRPGGDDRGGGNAGAVSRWP